jgi:hypothetical protein
MQRRQPEMSAVVDFLFQGTRLVCPFLTRPDVVTCLDALLRILKRPLYANSSKRSTHKDSFFLRFQMRFGAYSGRKASKGFTGA